MTIYYQSIFFKGNKKDIIIKLEKIKSLLYKIPQPTSQLNIDRLNKKIELVKVFNHEVISSMILSIDIDDETKEIIKKL